VLELVDKLSKQKHITVDYKIIQGADHFFRNKLGEFTQAINDYLQLRLLNNQVTHLKKDFLTEENLANKPLQKVFLD
jgi:hypothetical protein